MSNVGYVNATRLAIAYAAAQLPQFKAIPALESKQLIFFCRSLSLITDSLPQHWSFFFQNGCKILHMRIPARQPKFWDQWLIHQKPRHRDHPGRISRKKNHQYLQLIQLNNPANFRSNRTAPTPATWTIDVRSVVAPKASWTCRQAASWPMAHILTALV